MYSQRDFTDITLYIMHAYNAPTSQNNHNIMVCGSLAVNSTHTI
jgi:hypothetical protein